MAKIKKINFPAGVTLTSTVRKIINSREDDGAMAKVGVPTAETLGDLYGTVLPNPTMSFDDFIEGLHNQAKANILSANAYLVSRGEKTIATPSGSAFNNCNGKWTEDGYAVYAWNCIAELNRNSRAKANGGLSYGVYIH